MWKISLTIVSEKKPTLYFCSSPEMHEFPLLKLLLFSFFFSARFVHVCLKNTKNKRARKRSEHEGVHTEKTQPVVWPLRHLCDLEINQGYWNWYRNVTLSENYHHAHLQISHLHDLKEKSRAMDRTSLPHKHWSLRTHA